MSPLTRFVTYTFASVLVSLPHTYEPQYAKILDIIAKKSFAPKNDHKNYSDMCVLCLSIVFDLLCLVIRFHGWAAARADLKNEENRKAYVVLSPS
jgi:hypothetical protein